MEEARDAPGLRLVLTAGVPGPWGEAAKALASYKGLQWTPVRQEGGGENPALREWTGQTSAPVFVYEDLPPVCHWLDQLMLLERIAPAPALVPADPAGRAQVIGLSALVAGVEGYGWQRRLQMISPMMGQETPPPVGVRLAEKFGYSTSAAAGALDRMAAICRHLDGVLAAQEALGSDYFVGEAVTATDFYWASFLGMTMPLPPDVNPMPDFMRPMYDCRDEQVLGCISPRLVQHRDRMYARHIALPLDF